MASLPAHTLRIQRLYRGGLKTLMNWTVHRDLWAVDRGGVQAAQKLRCLGLLN